MNENVQRKENYSSILKIFCLFLSLTIIPCKFKNTRQPKHTQTHPLTHIHTLTRRHIKIYIHTLTINIIGSSSRRIFVVAVADIQTEGSYIVLPSQLHIHLLIYIFIHLVLQSVCRSVSLLFSLVFYDTHNVNATPAKINTLQATLLMGTHINQKLYDNIEKIIAVIGTIVYFTITNKIEFRLQRISTQYSTMGLILYQGHSILGRTFLFTNDNITTIKRTTTALR